MKLKRILAAGVVACLAVSTAAWAVSFSTNKGYFLPTVAGDPNLWGGYLNDTTAIIDNNMGGLATVNVSGSANVTATSTQAQNLVQKLTGTLTGSINYVLPAAGSFYIINNATTGAFTVTVVTSAGGSTGVAVTQGQSLHVWSDGTNVYPANGTTSSSPLIGTQYFTTPGTFTYTPTVGTLKVWIRAQAGDGAGAGLGATNGSQIAAAGPGGGGGYFEKTLSSGFSGASIVVGAAGIGASAATGGSGGNSSFSSFVAIGGTGGAPDTEADSANATGQPGGGGSTSGSPDLSVAGKPGSAYGILGQIGAVSINGFPGFGVLSAGGGAGQAQSQSHSATVGINGHAGSVIVFEYGR
jgi:hypothetical protein